MKTQCAIMSLNKLRLHGRYQAMCLEVISEDDWLHTNFGSDNNV